MAVLGRGNQRFDREISLVLQDSDSLQSTLFFTAGFYIRGIVFLIGAARPGGGPRPIVRVVEPATFRIQEVRCFVDRKKFVPLRGGIAPVDRLRPVKLGIAFRNEIYV